MGGRPEVARSSEVDVEKAFNEGTILRTHAMWPTWHIVSPAGIRWLLQVTAPRIHQANAHYCKKLEISATLLPRSHKIIVRALEGGHYLKRNDQHKPERKVKKASDLYRSFLGKEM